jgi:hypothetical protein
LNLIELDYSTGDIVPDHNFHAKVIQIAPDNHPEVATARTNLSDRLMARACWKFSQDDFRQMNEEALDKRSAILGSDHESLTIIVSMEHIA